MWVRFFLDLVKWYLRFVSHAMICNEIKRDKSPNHQSWAQESKADFQDFNACAINQFVRTYSLNVYLLNRWMHQDVNLMLLQGDGDEIRTVLHISQKLCSREIRQSIVEKSGPATKMGPYYRRNIVT